MNVPYTSVPLDAKLQQFCRETHEQIRRNFQTQAVFPFEVYPGYIERNAKKKGRNAWKSTGAAFDSLVFQVRDASMSQARIDAFFNYYLLYVDIGVGKGRNAENVEREATHDYRKRYTKWDPSRFKTHRPILLSEIRHLAGRMRMMYMRRFDVSTRAFITHSLEGLNVEE